MMKKVLFIYTTFYDYYKDIEDSLKRFGFAVDGFSYLVHESLKDRINIKFDSEYITKKAGENFIQELKGRKNESYDYIILLSGFGFLLPEHIKKLRSLFPSSIYINYIWDSVKIFPQAIKLSKYFDHTFSFDRADCEKYGFTFLPLFFVKRYTSSPSLYDYCSIMSYSFSKQELYRKLLSCLPKGLSSNQNLVMSNRVSYYYNRIVHPSMFKGIDKSILKFNALSREESLKIFSESKVTIDIPVQGQTGLTMRTFEVLACNRKIITTNKDIVHYPFYNPNNIFVFDNKIKDIPLSFFNDPFTPISGFEKYSVDSFAKRLIS